MVTPGHKGIEGNKKADEAAKKCAEKRRFLTARWTTLTYLRKEIKEAGREGMTVWYSQEAEKQRSSRRGFHIPQLKSGINPTFAKTPKTLAARFYQLKVGHGAVGVFLKRIGVVETDDCWWCGAPEQSVDHVYTKCRKWGSQRRSLKKELKEVEIRRERRPERKWLAALLADEQAVKPLIRLLSHTEIGKRKGAAEKAAEWEKRNDRDGEDLLDE